MYRTIRGPDCRANGISVANDKRTAANKQHIGRGADAGCNDFTVIGAKAAPTTMEFGENARAGISLPRQTAASPRHRPGSYAKLGESFPPSKPPRPLYGPLTYTSNLCPIRWGGAAVRQDRAPPFCTVKARTARGFLSYLTTYPRRPRQTGLRDSHW
jgi:hypothetical protein